MVKNKPNRTKNEHKCIQCGITYFKYVSPSRGTKFCSLQCSGKNRRIETKEIKRRHAIYLKDKMLNDPEFRARRLARKKAYYQENKERIEAHMKKIRRTKEYRERHAAYCRRPEYVLYKKSYDRRLRCRKKYGELAEAASILIDLENCIKEKASNYEIKLQNKTLNKAQNRRREYETKCRQLKEHSLGNSLKR